MKYFALSFALLLSVFLAGSLTAQESETQLPDWKKEFVPEDDSWKSVPQHLIFNNAAEPETLDPAIMTGVTEHTLALGLYEGLTSQDPETLEPRPGVAEDWTKSKDLLTYTFHFRKNAKWTNGERVTPEDFRWSFYRCLMGTVQCDYAYLYDYIEGAADFRKGEFIEIVFRARLFRGSTEFTSAVWNDAEERSATILQPTDGANAVDHVATDGVLVVVDEIVETDHVITVTPNPFTPNGDGVNEEASFDFDLFLLMSESSITVDIHDLSGRRVRRLAPAASSAGNVQLTWNGMDADGDLVPPGLYFFRLTVERDVGSHVRMGTLAVTY